MISNVFAYKFNTTQYQKKSLINVLKTDHSNL